MHYTLKRFYLKEVFGITPGKPSSNKKPKGKRSERLKSGIFDIRASPGVKNESQDLKYKSDKTENNFIKETAYSIIEKTLDVVSIIKELHKF